MKFKKSKAIYLSVLMLLAGTAMIDKISQEPKDIDIAVSAQTAINKAHTEYAALDQSIDPNNDQNEEASLIDLDSND